ncbi:hypothetical protein HK102_013637 [Quaeritorhiza haematococci]|nr:hypothetical protein HK102_013637 [Quaeritorhiza haematococci]
MMEMQDRETLDLAADLLLLLAKDVPDRYLPSLLAWIQPLVPTSSSSLTTATSTAAGKEETREGQVRGGLAALAPFVEQKLGETTGFQRRMWFRQEAVKGFLRCQSEKTDPNTPPLDLGVEPYNVFVFTSTYLEDVLGVGGKSGDEGGWTDENVGLKVR